MKRLFLALALALAATPAVADSVGPNYSATDVGKTRVNVTTGALEYWDGSQWMLGAAGLANASSWNAKDHGAGCTGSGNDTAAFAAAPSNTPIAIPGIGTLCNTTYSFLTAPNALVGPGQVHATGGNLAPIFYNQTSAPTALADMSAFGTSFNGDLSHVYQAFAKVVQGASTLGQPATGYLFSAENSGKVSVIYNTSGWNQATDSNDGRTGLEFEFVKMFQYGQGDLVSRFCTGVVASVKPGATSAFANPEIGCYGSDLYIGIDGAYAEQGDNNIHDNGHDGAGTWYSVHLYRDNATENLNANWRGLELNSSGSKPIDSMFRETGPIMDAIDFSGATLGNYQLAGITINSGGANYCVGDLLYVSGGTVVGPAASLVVTNTSGGSQPGNCGSIPAGGAAFQNHGMYSVPPVTSYANLTLTTAGAGSGAAISGQFLNNNAFILPSLGGCIRPGMTPGSPFANATNIYSSLCIYPWGMSFGGANNTLQTSNGAENFIAGDHNIANGTNNFFAGDWISDNARHNCRYWSSGSFAPLGSGKSQTATCIFRQEGVGSLRLTTDNGTAVANNTYTIPLGSTHNVGWRCTAIDKTTPANSLQWVGGRGLAHRAAAGDADYNGYGFTAVAFDYFTGAAATGATIQITADISLESLNIVFTPPTATNTDAWRPECVIDIDQALSS